jgi:hypothetical protein
MTGVRPRSDEPTRQVKDTSEMTNSPPEKTVFADDCNPWRRPNNCTLPNSKAPSRHMHRHPVLLSLSLSPSHSNHTSMFPHVPTGGPPHEASATFLSSAKAAGSDGERAWNQKAATHAGDTWDTGPLMRPA